MGILDDITLGRYVPGDSPMHRLDPRLKLAGLPVFVVAAFACSAWFQLAVLAAWALLLVLLSGVRPDIWWRGLWVMRWLFLFTLLLHVALSPGRTLAGLAWLSYDGLLQGLMVCSRLALAVVFSSMLTLTTSVEALACALRFILAPLRRFGLAVDSLVWQLQLVLRFLPALREDAAGLLQESRERGEDVAAGTLVERARLLRRFLAPLLFRLADRADAMAEDVVAGRAGPGIDTDFCPQFGFGGRETIMLSAGLGVLAAVYCGWI